MLSGRDEARAVKFWRLVLRLAPWGREAGFFRGRFGMVREECEFLAVGADVCRNPSIPQLLQRKPVILCFGSAAWGRSSTISRQIGYGTCLYDPQNQAQFWNASRYK